MTTFTLTNHAVRIEQEGSPSVDVPLDDLILFLLRLPIEKLPEIKITDVAVKVYND